MIRSLTLVAAFVIAIGYSGLAANVVAQEKLSRPAANGNYIEVTQCRVSLIKQVTLSSARAGVIAFISPSEGDHVKARQVLAGLDSSITEAALAVAREKAASTVNKKLARNMIDLTKTEYEKAIQANQKFNGGDLFADIEVRRLKLSMDKSALQLEQAEIENQVHGLNARQIEAELKAFTVEAQFDGIVTRVHRAKGEAVGLGDPLIEVVNLDRVKVEGYVSVQDGLRIKQGAAVSVRLDIPDVDIPEERIDFPGKLLFVDVGVEPVSGQIRVWAEVLNPDGILRAGLPARMKIQSPSIAAK